MKKFTLTNLALFFTPLISFAQTVDIQSFFIEFMLFTEDILIPFLFAVAFLFFIYNVVKYFVFEGNNENGREKAKSLAIYSVSAFVVIIIFWGVINLLVSSLGLQYANNPNDLVPDYIKVGPTN